MKQIHTTITAMLIMCMSTWVNANPFKSLATEQIPGAQLMTAALGAVINSQLDLKSLPAVPLCEVGKKSESVHLILTDHTVAYTEPELCQPQPIEDFTATLVDTNGYYTLNWSIQNHDLWHVSTYEIRTNGSSIQSHPYGQPMPLFMAISDLSLLSTFEVRACTFVPSDDPNDTSESCGQWTSTTTVCAVNCVDGSLPVPSLSLSTLVSSNGDFVVSWSDLGYDRYELQEKTTDTWTTVQSGASLSHTFQNKTNNTVFHYRVMGCDGNNCSQYSAERSVSVVMEMPSFQPTNPVNTSGQYTIRWNPVFYTSQVERYKLQESPDGLNWSSVYNEYGFEYTFKKPNGVTNHYRVKACRPNNNCSDFMSGVSVTVTIMPEVPTLHVPTGVNTTGNYTVSWSQVAYATNYQLQQTTDGSNWQTIQNSSQLSMVFTNQPDDLTYGYRVRACNLNVCSNYSPVSSITVELPNFAQPPGPANHALQQNAASSVVGFTSGDLRVDMSGAAAYSVPVHTPTGIGGLSPDLSLTYSSHDLNNGIAGVGWHIGGLSSISRCLKNVEQDNIAIHQHKPINLTSDDAYCLDGQKLFQVPGTGNNGMNGAEYRTEIETFTKIQVVGTHEAGPATFKAWLKNGEIRTYGATTGFNAQIKADGSNKVISWLLNKTEDRHGNAIWYIWDNDTVSGDTYLERVEYTRRSGDSVFQNQILFNYENRNDKSIRYSRFNAQKQIKRLSSITTQRKKTRGSAFQTIRELKIAYEYSAVSKRSLVRSITSCANQSVSSCLKPVEFDWSGNVSDIGFSDKQSSGDIIDLNHLSGYYKTIDLNGDGRRELIFPKTRDTNLTNPETRFVTAGNSAHINLLDNDGEGCGTTGGYFNKSCNTDIQPVEPEDHSLTNNDYFVYDFNGDGNEDLLSPVKQSGVGTSYWTISYSNGEKLCKSTASGTGCLNQTNTNIEWHEVFNEGGAAFVDFSADGLPDLMRFADNNEFVSYGNSTGTVYFGHMNNNGSSITYHDSQKVALDIDTSQTPLDLYDIFCHDGDDIDPQSDYIECADQVINFGPNAESLPSVTELTSITSLNHDVNGDGLSDVLISYRHLFNELACEGGGIGDIENYPLEDSDCWVKWWAVHTYEPTGTGTATLKHLETIGMSTGWGLRDMMVSTDNGQTIGLYQNPHTDLGRAENVRLDDFNGDGLSDVVLKKGVMFNQGLGFTDMVPFNWHLDPDHNIDSAYQDDLQYLTQYIDYDHDGDIDVIYPGPESASSDNYVKYRVRTLEYDQNSGYYFADKVETTAIARSKDAEPTAVVNVFEDFNGDSFVDHLFVKLAPGDEKFTEFSNGAWQPKDRMVTVTKTSPSGLKDETQIKYESATLPTVYSNTYDGFGQQWGNGSFVFDYKSPSLYLVRQMNTLSPVKHPSNSSHMAAWSSIYYHYKGMKMQGGGRGSLGFAEMSTVDVQNNISTQTTYRQDFPFHGAAETTLTSHHNSLFNQPNNQFSCTIGVSDCGFAVCSGTACMDPLIKGSVFDPISDSLNVYESIYPASTAGSHYYFMQESVEDHYELNASSVVKTTATVIDLENKTIPSAFHGNVSSHTDQVCRSYQNGVCDVLTQTVTNNQYNHSNHFVNNWMLGRLSNSTTTQFRLDEDPLSQQYNQLVAVSNTASYVYDTVTGQLVEESSGSGEREYMKTKRFYDTYGNETNTLLCSLNIVQTNRCVTSYLPPAHDTNKLNIFRHSVKVYDPQWHSYVNQSSSLFGTAGFASRMVTTGSVTSRDVHGNALVQNDLINGTVTEHVYGLFGEPQATKSNLGTFTSTLNSWCTTGQCPNGAVLKTEQQTAGAPKSREFKDAQGRTVRSQTQSMGTVSHPGAWITTDTWYDQSGRSNYATIPYLIANAGSVLGGVYLTEVNFDPLGRVLSTITPNHAGTAITSSIYSGLQLTEINPKGQKKVSHYDESGQVIQIDQYNDKNVVYSSIQYYYGPNDKLERMSSNGTDTIMTYDNLGRKKTMSDPDKGNWIYNYNPLGDMTSQIDGLGQAIYFSFDVKGRLIEKKGTGLVGNQQLDNKWVFDEDNNNGKLTREISITHSPTAGENWTERTEKHLSYDQFGRPSQTSTRIYDGEAGNGFVDYEESTTYDQYSRVFQNIDATGNGVMYLYDAYGYQNKTLEAAACEAGTLASCEAYGSDSYRLYYQAFNMDAFGNITKDQYHNGSLTTVRNYNPTDGIMENTCIDENPTDHCGSDEMDKLVFSFDKMGNLLTKQDKFSNETFTYDFMNRLKTENRFLGGGNQFISYGYAPNGNLIQKGQDTLSYSEINAGPHAVTGFKGTSFSYDAVGNMVSSSGGEFQRTIQYTGLNKAYLIDNLNNNHSTYFIYDANHSRAVRKDRDGAVLTKVTHYIGNVEMIKSLDQGGVESYKRYIGSLIIDMPTKQSAQSDWQYMYQLKDHLGTSHSIISLNAVGQLIEDENLSFDAWGKRRWVGNLNESDINAGHLQFSDVIDKTTKGYTGHEHLDEMGIIHMNGRIYAPSMGRFLQADPYIQDPYNTQNLNRYTYVSNNPLSLNDPSGYWSWSAFRRNVGNSIFTTVLGTVPGVGPHLAAIFQGGMVAHATGSKGAGLKAAFSAYASAAAYGSIGNEFSGELSFGRFAAKIALHGLVGGANSLINGGKFGHGFASAGVTQAFAPLIKKIPYKGLRVASAAIIGGTVSEETGGKFANGAITGAFSRIFNDEAHDQSDEEKLREKHLRIREIRTHEFTPEEEEVFKEAVDALLFERTLAEDSYFNSDYVNREIGVVLLRAHYHDRWGIYKTKIGAQMSVPNPMLPESGTYMAESDGFYFDYLFYRHNNLRQQIPYNRHHIGDGAYGIFGTVIITPSIDSHRSLNAYKDRMINLYNKTGAPSFLIHGGKVYGFH